MKNTNLSQKEIEIESKKIKQILETENFESGFDLLQTINNQKLSESLSELIIKRFNDKYQTGNIKEGLEILYNLLPNISSLDLSYFSMLELDLLKFEKIEELNLSACTSLKKISGLNKLDKLISIDISYTPLYNSDIENSLGHTDIDIIGNKDECGMISIDPDFEDQVWWSYLDENYLFSTGYGQEKENLGKMFFISISEGEYYSKDPGQWENVTTIEFNNIHTLNKLNAKLKDKLGPWLKDIKIENLDFDRKGIIDKDCMIVYLLCATAAGYDVITHFNVYKETIDEDC